METQHLGILSKDFHDVQENGQTQAAQCKGPEKEAAFICAQGTFERDGKQSQWRCLQGFFGREELQKRGQQPYPIREDLQGNSNPTTEKDCKSGQVT